jgi:hypothetical protein
MTPFPMLLHTPTLMISRLRNQAISCLTGDVLHGDLCAAPDRLQRSRNY